MLRRVLFTLVLALSLGALIAGSWGTGRSAAAPQHSGKTITLGNIGWDEDVAANYVVKAILEDKYGYTVNLKLADVGPLYQGVSDGSLDAFLDTWLPVTHSTYWARYHAKIVRLPSWYKGRTSLGLAVPNYVKAQSIADLAMYKSQFGGKIVGIEPGAGEMRIVETKAVPGYHLNYTVQSSSTAAMLAALKTAIAHKQWIVVTLWTPHWAFTAYPIRYLKDPKGLMGGSEHIYTIVRPGLQTADPQAYKLLKKLSLTDMQLGTLELQIRKNPSDPEAGARAWVKSHQALVNTWLK